MSNEDKLRKQIKTVLDAIKQPEERVIDKHGSSEFGLDLIILKLDAFGKPRAHGVQIKTGNIKCSGKPTQKIKEIIGQLSIAFGKTVFIDGKDYKLDGFYVVTNGEFQGNTEDYIRSACIGIRNLHFIDKQSLDEFNRKYGSAKAKFEQT